MPETSNGKRFWIPHIASMSHEASPSGRTYCVQMRVPKSENSGHDYVVLTDFTLDYTVAQMWLKAQVEMAGRYLWRTK